MHNFVKLKLKIYHTNFVSPTITCCIWSFASLFASINLKAQDFTFEHQDNSDSVIWFVKNNTTHWVKPTALTLNWFHMKPSLLIWDASNGGASYSNTLKEKTKGSNCTFQFKTTRGVGINDTIWPNQRIPVLYSVNYDAIKSDTVMPANAILFYKDSTTKDGEIEVMPPSTACNFKRVFTNSFGNAQGVHFRSGNWTSLNQGVCQAPGYICIMVIFDQSTFKPTSAGILPKCPSGRLIKAFGYPIDSQVYYSFQLTETSHIDSLVNAITNGDYVAFVSWPGFNLSEFSALKKTFSKIGMETDSLKVGPFGNADNQFTFWGRKGLKPGEGRLNALGRLNNGNASFRPLSSDHVMIKGQAANQLSPYSACYESLIVIHQPYVPEPKISTNRFSLIPIIAHPNPADKNFEIPPTLESIDWTIINSTGQLSKPLNITRHSSPYQSQQIQYINCEDWANGLYVFRGIGKTSGKSYQFKIIIQH